MKLRQIAKHCNNLGGGGKLGGTTQIRGGGANLGARHKFGGGGEGGKGPPLPPSSAATVDVNIVLVQGC